jgi:hypothetical protein
VRLQGDSRADGQSAGVSEGSEPRWLLPSDAEILTARLGGIELRYRGDVFRGVFAVNLFPATDPDDYISLRIWTRDGTEQEIGILRHLVEWPTEARVLVREALNRRYWLQTVTGLDDIKLEMGHLTLSVRTPHGPRNFTMRWSQAQVQDFGERGKILLDLDDNRFLVPDVEALPEREQEQFLRYVYW